MSDDEDLPAAKRNKSLEITSDLEASPPLLPPSSSSNPFLDNFIPSFKIFNDSIHGSVELHWLLVKIIDTPQFQRLRRLRQLGPSYYVFPGASHQRFEHSIGTCHLAGELLAHLCQVQPELEITPKDILCVQMAALCHDIGHGPFSHLFEEVVNELRPNRNWSHEEASLSMLDYLIASNNLQPFFEQVGINNIDIIFVKELIFGELNKSSSNEIWPYKGRDISKSFLYEIVSNKLTGIDVDKFDYFARDDHHLGTKVSFDHARYIKFYRVIQVDDGKRHLCLREKEVKTCYDIYRIREDLHRSAYKHPVVNGIGLMLIEAFLSVNNWLLFTNATGQRSVRLADAVDHMYAFSQLDDHILTLIKHSNDAHMDAAKEIIDKIERREIYRYIGSTHTTAISLDKEACKRARQEIIDHCVYDEKAFQITHSDLVIQAVELTCGDRGEDPIRNMWFYTKECPNKATKISKEQVSTLLPQTFREQDIRLYCKNRDRTICSIIRCGFKEFCKTKRYTMPKGSEHWIPMPKQERIYASSLSVEHRSTLQKAVTH